MAIHLNISPNWDVHATKFPFVLQSNMAALRNVQTKLRQCLRQRTAICHSLLLSHAWRDSAVYIILCWQFWQLLQAASFKLGLRAGLTWLQISCYCRLPLRHIMKPTHVVSAAKNPDSELRSSTAKRSLQTIGNSASPLAYLTMLSTYEYLSRRPWGLEELWSIEGVAAATLKTAQTLAYAHFIEHGGAAKC
jgi:hypothetical protein